MPIVETMALVPVKSGDGGTVAEIPRCINCRRYVVPCKCRLIDGQRCGPPFYGLVHLDSNSHVCSFPRPGASFADAGKAQDA